MEIEEQPNCPFCTACMPSWPVYNSKHGIFITNKGAFYIEGYLRKSMMLLLTDKLHRPVHYNDMINHIWSHTATTLYKNRVRKFAQQMRFNLIGSGFTVIAVTNIGYKLTDNPIEKE